MKQWCIPLVWCHRRSYPLCRCSILVGVNLDSRDHYIDAGGGAHCPLIEEIAPDQGMKSGLWSVVAKPIRH
jgi:hypothetical protein